MMMPFDRITEVLRPFSGIDKIPASVLEKACIRGTAVHQEIQAIQNNLWMPGLDLEYQGYIDCYHAWAKDKKFITPERFYEKDKELTGECDALYELEKDTYCLVDFKTSRKAYGKQKDKMQRIWGMQLAAYTHMANQSGFKITRVELVQLSQSESADTYDFTTQNQKNWSLFLICLEIYRQFFKSDKLQEMDWEWL